MDDSAFQLELTRLLDRGERIAAIKLVRAHRGIGLREAKQEIDRLSPPPAGGCLAVLLASATAGLLVLLPLLRGYA